MKSLLKLASVAVLIAAPAGCSETKTEAPAPTASKVKEAQSKAGKQTPSGSAAMPKEPGR